MNNNKINGYHRNKTIKKTKIKKKISFIDDDGAKMHCSLANSVPHESQQSTVKVMNTNM